MTLLYRFSFLLSALFAFPAFGLDFKKVPDSELYQFTSTNFDRFLVYDPKAFKQYDQLLLFPMQFNRLKIDAKSDKSLLKSWNASNWKEMDEICQNFDDLAYKISSEQAFFKPTNKGGNNVLAIEFRLMKFTPRIARKNALNTKTMESSNNASGIGDLVVQAYIVHSQTGKMVALIEDGMEVTSGQGTSQNLDNQFDNTNRMAQNLAWRATFKRWISRLQEDLNKLHLAEDADLVISTEPLPTPAT